MEFIFLTLGYHPDLAGGAYRYVTEVAERLASRGHSVEVVYPCPDGLLVGEEKRNGVRLRRFIDEKGPFWRNWIRENQSALAIWKEGQANPKRLTLICHGFFQRALKGMDGHRVFLFTGPWAEEYRMARRMAKVSFKGRCLDWAVIWAMRRAEGKALRGVNRILTISEYYRGKFPEWHGDGLPAMDLIYGGVDLERFSPSDRRVSLRERWGLKSDEVFFLSIRRLAPRMGLTMLLEGFAKVSKDFPEARLGIAGRGPLEEELRNQIMEFGLEGKARLLGFVAEEELPGLYESADFTVMPSLDLEGFGLSTVESLACGTPVLGSSSGATPELLKPLSRNLIFNSGSSESLAEKLMQVKRGKEAFPGRAECRTYAENRYSWDRPVEGVERAYMRLVKNG